MQTSRLVDTMSGLTVGRPGALTIAVMGYFFLLTNMTDPLPERSIDRFITTNPRFLQRKRQRRITLDS